MSELGGRYDKIAGRFTEKVRSVRDGAWDNPSPCEGWVARDIVGHLVEWLPDFFFGTWGIDARAMPSVREDPVGAWEALDAAIRSAFDDPSIANAPRDTRMGPATFEQTFDMIGTNDILIHTWDLARATGQDETLDPDEVHKLYAGMEPHDEAMRSSGHYGPRVQVPDDADEQTKLIAFMGRTP